MSILFDVMRERQDQLFSALIAHVQISFIALFLALMIAVPLGIHITRHPNMAEGLIGLSAVLQTIPSLALLGLLIPLLGIGTLPAITALVAYALLPILRNTYTGIKEVDPSLTEAAQAMGMSNLQRLIKVELPLALPVIMAGIRTAMVLIVGTATLAALIGAGGLGDIILLGIDRNDSMLIVLGAVPAALLALFFDFLLRKLERLPFNRLLTAFGVLGAALLLLIVVPLAAREQPKKIVIAGKLGAEPEILIHMYQLLIEKNTDLKVELKPGLGKTSFLFHALQSGSIDMYPEFTGTAISEFLRETAASTDAAQVYDQARSGLKDKFDLVLLEPMQYNNTYTLAMPEAIAEKYQLKKISDLEAVQQMVKAGFTLEFADREDGYRGIQELYGIAFPQMKTMEPKLRYTAIETGDINLVDAYSTDSELRQHDLVVLEDDKHLFPPYQGAPIMRSDTAKRYPELVEALNRLAGRITDEEMREMNYEVNAEGRSARDIAKQFLTKEGLL